MLCYINNRGVYMYDVVIVGAGASGLMCASTLIHDNSKLKDIPLPIINKIQVIIKSVQEEAKNENIEATKSNKIFDISLLATLKDPKKADIAKVAIINIISKFQKRWNKQQIHSQLQAK